MLNVRTLTLHRNGLTRTGQKLVALGADALFMGNGAGVDAEKWIAFGRQVQGLADAVAVLWCRVLLLPLQLPPEVQPDGLGPDVDVRVLSNPGQDRWVRDEGWDDNVFPGVEARRVQIAEELKQDRVLQGVMVIKRNPIFTC